MFLIGGHNHVIICEKCKPDEENGDDTLYDMWTNDNITDRFGFNEWMELFMDEFMELFDSIFLKDGIVYGGVNEIGCNPCILSHLAPRAPNPAPLFDN